MLSRFLIAFVAALVFFTASAPAPSTVEASPVPVAADTLYLIHRVETGLYLNRDLTTTTDREVADAYVDINDVFQTIGALALRDQLANTDFNALEEVTIGRTFGAVIQ